MQSKLTVDLCVHYLHCVPTLKKKNYLSYSCLTAALYVLQMENIELLML